SDADLRIKNNRISLFYKHKSLPDRANRSTNVEGVDLPFWRRLISNGRRRNRGFKQTICGADYKPKNHYQGAK
ncbi:MAG: hypothetical protein V3R30_12020, partial [Kiloniellales bacterium]